MSDKPTFKKESKLNQVHRLPFGEVGVFINGHGNYEINIAIDKLFETKCYVMTQRKDNTMDTFKIIIKEL